MNRGESILNLVRNIQKLNGEIAALIKTFDRQLKHEGFQSEGGSSVIRDCSTSLDRPEAWAPLGMYRIFKKETDKDDVVVLNVALASTYEPERLQEPLVVCGRFQYREGQASKCVGVWDAWDLWMYKAADKTNYVFRKAELGVNTDDFLTKSKWLKEEIEAMREIRFLAVPLAQLVDRKVLEREIIKPIL